MELSILMTIADFLITGISFWGLCAFIRHQFDIDSMIAPFAAACGVIIAMMAAGMLGVLRWMQIALHVGGLAAFIYYYLIRKKKPDWLAAGMLTLSFAYGLLHFNGFYLGGSDTVSHWGMAAKYLLLNDKFPDASTELIYFQSYPLGTASFIYYFCKNAGLAEGLFLCAQFVLNAIAFMPVLALVKKNRVAGLLLSAVAFLFMVTYNVNINTLQVDTLIPLFALGGTAAVFYYHSDIRRSVAIGIVAAVSLVFIKTSGVLFGILIAVLVLRNAKVYSAKKHKTQLIVLATLFAVGIALAFISWNTHVKIAYGSATATKHAVSISSYAQAFRSKLDDGLIVSIAHKMIRRLMNPKWVYKLMILAAFAVFSGCAFAILISSSNRKKWGFALIKTICTCIVLYAIWYVMLYFMYVFSMPTNEAQKLASITRYEKTMQLYIMGIILMFVLNYFCGQEAFDIRYGKTLAVCTSLLCTCGLLLVSVKGDTHMIKRLTSDKKVTSAHQCVLSLRDKYEIEDEKRYLILSRYNKRNVQNAHYLIKYEFLSNDIMMIIGGIKMSGFDPEGYYTFQNTVPFSTDYAETEDIAATLLQYADDYDYIFVLDEDPAFETAINEFLKNYDGDTPVMHAYS